MQHNGPVIVLNANAKRDFGRSAQLANIAAARAIADIVRTTLGPKSMLKMLLDPMGGIVMTNDGNAILREVDVTHPAAKSLIELSRAQDEEVGDGTTSVVILAGEMLSVAEPFLKKQIHPTVIVAGYLAALEDALAMMEGMGEQLDLNDDKRLLGVIDSCLSTKFSARWGDLISALALKAAKTVTIRKPGGTTEIDVKRFARVEKVPGGEWEDSKVLEGVMVNKDVTHARMRRHITNPRIVLLDCPLEYKKGESQTAVEVTEEDHWEKLLKQEETEVKKMCDDIIKTGCDVVVTEKGVSDLAQHFLLKAGVSVIRRVRKTDNNRIARVSGATIVTRTEELLETDVGHGCHLFQVSKIGDEYFTYFVECDEPTACTILLRGGSKDVLNEVERNLHDAMNVARNILLEARLLPGGGATEMELAARLMEKAKTIEGVRQWPYKAVAQALEVIPRVLLTNCGVDVVRTLTALRSKHATAEGANFGVDGVTGEIIDVTTAGIWDTMSVKQQVIKAAVESAAMIVRIDDVLSGVAKKGQAGMPGAPIAGEGADPETFGDQRDG